MRKFAAHQAEMLHIQMEVDFETLSGLEDFWSSIPATEHKAWSQRMQVRPDDK